MGFLDGGGVITEAARKSNNKAPSRDFSARPDTD